MRGNRILLFVAILLVVPAFSAAQGDAPEATRGHLVIVGGGRIPEGVRMRFFALAGGKSARLGVVPTASGRAGDADAEERYLGPWRWLGAASMELVHVRNRDADALARAARTIDDLSGVWLSGGDQARLVDAYRDTVVARALHRLLARGGVIGGTSAGAACMSDPMIAGGNPEAVLAPGFGFLPGIVVDQHFGQRNRLPRLLGVIRAHPELCGIGIDESTAIEVSGRRATVVGPGEVTVVLAAGAGREERIDVLRRNHVLDLPQLRRAAAGRAHPAPRPEPGPLAAGAVVVAGGEAVPAEAWRTFVAARAERGPLIVVTPGGDAERGAAIVASLREHGALAVEVRERMPPLDAAGVWVAGVRPWQVIDLGADFAAALRRVLARGGVVGASAGVADVLGSVVVRGHPLDDSIMLAEGYDRGLDLLPGFAIETHCGQRDRGVALAELVAGHPPLFGLCIEDGTAVVARGASLEVLGGGAATCTRSWSDRPTAASLALSAGEAFDFVRWSAR